jgi:surfeit locus 1 family protein
MLAGYSFRPRVWALVLAAAACAAGIALGNWQAGRAAQKRGLGMQFERALSGPAIELPATRVKAEEFVHKKVSARGAFAAKHTVLLMNRQRRGSAGFEVITPFKLKGSDLHVLVNRGWVREQQDFRYAPGAFSSPEGEVRIEGMALRRLPRVLELGDGGSGEMRQNVDIEEFANETRLALQPIVIEQRSETGDGLLRDWPRPDVGAEKNAAYSFQWYSLAALAVALAVVLSFRKDAK